MKLQGTIPLITRPLVGERVSSVVDDLDQTITDIRAAIFSLQARGGTCLACGPRSGKWLTT